MHLAEEMKTIVLNVPECKVYDFSKRLSNELKLLIMDLHAPHETIIEDIPGKQITASGSEYGVWHETEIRFRSMGHEITEVTIHIITGNFLGRTVSGHVMRHLVGSFKSFEMGYLASKKMMSNRV